MHSVLPQLAALAALLAAPAAAGTVWYEGCFSSAGSLKLQGSNNYQSHNSCVQKCGSQAVAALTGGNACYCGNSLPTSVVADTKCNKPCTGYPDEMCGGSDAFSIYLTGEGTLNSGAPAPSASSAASSPSPTISKDPSPLKPGKTSSTASVPTPGPDPLQTQTSTATSTDASSSSSSSSSPTTTTSSAPTQSSSSAANAGALSAGALGFVGLAAAAFL